MTCEEFLNLLDEDQLQDNAEASAHAEACPSCRAALERWRVVRHEFTAMRDEPAPPFLHTRVMAHVQGAPPDRHWFGWLTGFRPTWATTLLVLVLGIALGGLGVWRWRPSPAGGSRPQPARLGFGVEKAEPAPRRAVEASPKPAEPSAPPSRFPALDQLPSRQAPEEAPRRKEAERPPGETAGRPEPEVGDRTAAAAPSPASREAEPGAEPETPIFQGAANGGGPAGSRPSTPEPAVREELPAAPADASALVVCTLKSLDQGNLMVLQLPSEAAPPPSAAWSILVGGDGSMTVLDASGARIPRPHPGLMGVLASERLSPGRYLLKRVG